jgi:hypothetical protein
VAVDVQLVRALCGEGQIPSFSRTDASSPRTARLAGAAIAKPPAGMPRAIGYAKRAFAGPAACGSRISPATPLPTAA